MDVSGKVKWGLRWLPSFLSEPDGTGSSTRLYIGLVVAFVVGAGTALVCKIHQPITVADLNSFLTAAGTFVAVICAPLYGLNKLANVTNNRSQQDPDRNQ
jgi:hypothetical protein